MDIKLRGRVNSVRETDIIVLRSFLVTPLIMEVEQSGLHKMAGYSKYFLSLFSLPTLSKLRVTIVSDGGLSYPESKEAFSTNSSL